MIVDVVCLKRPKNMNVEVFCQKRPCLLTHWPLTHWGRDKMAAFRYFQMYFLELFSLKFVPRVPIDNKPTLVHVMVWHRPGDKPLSGTIMISLLNIYASLSLNELIVRYEWNNKATMVQVMASGYQAITWVNGDPDLCCHMASLGHNDLSPFIVLEHHRYESTIGSGNGLVLSIIADSPQQNSLKFG